MGPTRPDEIAGQEGKIFEEDVLMKPLRCGISEVKSYQTFAVLYKDLLPYIPRFLGTEWRLDESGQQTEYLVMENLTKGFVKPCYHGHKDWKVQ